VTTPVFPYLPGLTWPIDRAPIWDTSVQKALSGKQTRFANKTQPTYRYSAVISGLDSSGTFSSLSAYSKQSLEALFNQTQGGAGIFNFFDPYDSFASAQQFGVGDGTTTAFQLMARRRTMSCLTASSRARLQARRERCRQTGQSLMIPRTD
jgi:hypothetical protein